LCISAIINLSYENLLEPVAGIFHLREREKVWSYVGSLRDKRSLIHESTSSSLYATRFAEMRTAFGKFFARSNLNSVVRDKLVLFKTSSLESNCTKHLHVV
jgi:hypothetical protein